MRFRSGKWEIVTLASEAEWLEALLKVRCGPYIYDSKKPEGLLGMETRLFTKVLEVFLLPGGINGRNILELTAYESAEIRLTYDFRSADMPTCQVIIKEAALTRLESEVWRCNGKHKAFRKTILPIQHDYVPRCYACGEPMKRVMPPLMPELRGTIQRLPTVNGH